MKNFTKKYTYPALLIAGLPLLILGGCAGNDTKSFTGDMAAQEADINEQIINEGLSQETFEHMPLIISAQDAESYQVEVENLEEGQQAVSTDLAVETSGSAGVESIDPKGYSLSEPQEQIIGFGFDQSDIDAQYLELLGQHAEYLMENENLVVNISGHTDLMGDRSYNEYLSKKRADAVASTLMEFGVEKGQIKVSGNASDEPLMGAISHKEHRRVELNYQDQQIVSN